MSFTFHHMRPYVARLAAYGFFVVLAVLFTMATALSVADFVKILFPPDPSSLVVPSAGESLLSQLLDRLYTWLIAFGPKHALIYFSLILLVLYSCKNIFNYLSNVQIAVIRSRIVRDLRSQLFRKALRLPLSYYGTHRKGDILARFAGDMTEYDESVLGSLQQLFMAAVSILLYTAMLFYISVKLSLFVLCMLPVVAFVISGISHRLRRESVELQQRGSSIMSLMEETIIGLKVIKAYTAIEFSNRRFSQAGVGYARLRTRVLRRVDLSSPVSDFLGNSVVIGILLFGSAMVIRGDSGITPELFVSYIMMFVLMIPPAKELTTAISHRVPRPAFQLPPRHRSPARHQPHRAARRHCGIGGQFGFRQIHPCRPPHAFPRTHLRPDTHRRSPHPVLSHLVPPPAHRRSGAAHLSFQRFHPQQYSLRHAAGHQPPD